jgi:DNA polymerase-3 subunit gamma/tau
MLSSSAFNAFLKTLEEPPPYAIFILATTEKHKILPTILSRCQIFDFKRITGNDTVDHLQNICKKEEIDAEKAALQVIARKSEGCMRDALSILDKIVSFTSGTVTYQNTLEHLNILDADYYFKLLDCMQQQDLAGAMLLYDDIDRKGFEGDLLEVVESFKDKYIATGKNTPVAYLISALNILNEAEINFKGARNKRLHTELAIIKLTYLQQALELAATGDGVSKKKLVEGASSVAFRKLGFVEDKGKKTESQPQPQQRQETVAQKPEVVTRKRETPVQQPQPAYQQPANEARLMIEEPAVDYISPEEEELNYINSMHSLPANEQQPKPVNTATNRSAGPKLGTLESIRQKFANKTAGATNPAIPLTLEKLQQDWADFSQRLKDNKNPAAQSFDMARLVITSENSFEIVTNNNLEQKFIEGERRELSEYMQAKFNNRTLLFTIVVTDNPVAFVPTEKPLSTKEQYVKIIEQYPLVNELRAKLKLGFE